MLNHCTLTQRTILTVKTKCIVKYLYLLPVSISRTTWGDCDQIRNQRLYELGWDVMRFWVYEVRDEIDYCVSKVNQWVEKP